MSHISDPSTFSSTCIHTCLFRGFVLVRGGFCSGDCLGFFCPEGFVRGGFCPSPFCQNTSITTEKKTSLSILGFICMKFFLKCDVTCSWSPPPVTNCHSFSDPLPLERNVLYGRHLNSGRFKAMTFKFYAVGKNESVLATFWQ